MFEIREIGHGDPSFLLSVFTTYLLMVSFRSLLDLSSCSKPVLFKNKQASESPGSIVKLRSLLPDPQIRITDLVGMGGAQ